jgi:hypothetical protein
LQEQLKDGQLRQIYEFLQGTYTPPTPKEKKLMEKRAKPYSVVQNAKSGQSVIAARDPKAGHHHVRVAVPEGMQHQILSLLHDNPYGGGHLGSTKVMAIAKRHFFWPTLSADLRSFIKTCDICQRRNVVRRHVPPSDPMPNPTRRWEIVAMDIAGPLPTTRKGNRYILVIVDYLTRWVEAFPLPNQEAMTVATTWVRGCVCRWGVPRHVITDQGTNFTSAVMRATYKILGTNRKATTPYHPQSNGLVERFNRTIKDILVKLAEDREDDWDELIEMALMSYRSVPGEATGDSPFFLMLGMDPRLPCNTTTTVVEGLRDEAGDEIADFAESMAQTEMCAHKRLHDSQQRTKRRHDSHVFPKVFPPGSLALLEVTTRKPGGKMLPRWTGPYEVIQRHPKTPNAIIIRMKNGHTRTVNVGHLRPT